MAREAGNGEEQRAGHYMPLPPLELWSRIIVDDDRLNREREDLSHLSEDLEDQLFNTIVERMARQAAVESIAIEDIVMLQPGESWTVAIEEADWEQIFERQNETGKKLFESHLEALKYVDRYPRDSDVTEMFIKELHQLACAGQETYDVLVPTAGGGLARASRTFTPGIYKDLANNATRNDRSIHYYAPPLDVPPEMDRFVRSLNSAEFRELHPAVKVAYSHYGLVHIHPFPDGNGRTARVLASRFAYAAYGIPLLVFADRKETYLQSLEGVSLGEPREFAHHVAARLTDTLSHAVQQAKHLRDRPLREHIETFKSYLENYTDTSVESLTAVGARIVTRAAEMIESSAQDIHDTSAGVIAVEIQSVYIGTEHLMNIDAYAPQDQMNFYDHGFSKGNFGYGPLAGRITLRVTSPVEAKKEFRVGVGVSNDPAIPFPFKVSASDTDMMNRSNLIELRYEDCSPSLGTNAEGRLQMLIEKAFIDGVRSLYQEVDRIIAQAGSLKR